MSATTVLPSRTMGDIFNSATRQLAKSLAASSGSVSWSKVQMLLARAPRLPKLSERAGVSLPLDEVGVITAQMAVSDRPSCRVAKEGERR